MRRGACRSFSQNGNHLAYFRVTCVQRPVSLLVSFNHLQACVVQLPCRFTSCTEMKESQICVLDALVWRCEPCATPLTRAKNLPFGIFRVYFSKLPQLFGILITIGEAVAYVVSGMYGDLSTLGAGNAILIICQLFFAGLIVIILDELLQKG